MRVRLILAFTILLIPTLSNAQKVKLVSSSSTSWSGGIAGRYGTSYNFTVEFSDCRKHIPEPDTLWIGNKCIPIVEKTITVAQNYNTVRTAGKKKLSFQITGGTNHEDDPLNVNNLHSGNKKATLPHAPIKYSGVALLSYKYKGEQRYFIIDRIMTNNPPVNYP